jgi:hypothetical protein
MLHTATAEMRDILEGELSVTYGEPMPELEPGDQERYSQDEPEESVPEIDVASAPTIEEILENSYGGHDGWGEYNGPAQLDGSGGDLLFDGERLWQNGAEITDEWTHELIEKWSAGEAYTFSWTEKRGGEEFLCVGIGIAGEDGRPVWTNMETHIPADEDETIAPEEAAEPERIPEAQQNFSEAEVAEEAPEKIEEFGAEALAERGAGRGVEHQAMNEKSFEQINVPAAYTKAIETPAREVQLSVADAAYEFSHEAELALIDRKHFVPIVEAPTQSRTAVTEVAPPKQENVVVQNRPAESIQKAESAPEEFKQETAAVNENIKNSIAEPTKIAHSAQREPAKSGVVAREYESEEVLHTQPAHEAARETSPADKKVERISTEQVRETKQIIESPIEKTITQTRVKQSKESVEKTAALEKKPDEVMNEKITESLTRIFAEPLIANTAAERTPVIDKPDTPPTEPFMAEKEQADIPTPDSSRSHLDEHEVIVSARVAPILRMLGIPHVIESEDRQRQERSNYQGETSMGVHKTFGNPAPDADEQENERATHPFTASSANDVRPSQGGITLRRAA